MLGLYSIAVSSAAIASGSVLFKYQGKAVSAEELSPALQQTFFDIQLEHHMRMAAFADQVVFERHITELAQKLGKDRQTVEMELLRVDEPKEKDIKAWYDENRGRIPPNYKLEQISGEIANLIKNEAKKKKRDELLARLKREGQFQLSAVEPLAPILNIALDNFPTRGKADAKVTLVEFADFLCPHCKEASSMLESVMGKYKSDVKLVFLDFPIKGETSNLVAYGAYCAEQQGKYWEFHHLAFAKQEGLSKDSPLALAAELKLDESKFKACMASGEAEKRVARSRAEGERIGVTGTPTIFINGRRARGHDQAQLESEIQRALNGNVSR